MPIRSKNKTEKTTNTPPMAPIMMELVGETLAQPAVMATSPASAPFRLMPMSGFLKIIQEVSIPVTHPAAAAKLVLTKIVAMVVSPMVVEPGLNPNQPSHRIKTPIAAKGILWPGKALTLIVLQKV